MCRQDYTLSDTSTTSTQNVRRSGTPPGGCSGGGQGPQPSPKHVINNELPPSPPPKQGRRTPRERRRNLLHPRTSRSGTPPGGCSSSHIFTDATERHDRFKPIHLETLFKSCAEHNTGGASLNNDVISTTRQNNDKCSPTLSVQKSESPSVVRGAVSQKGNSKDEETVLKCNNLSIVEIVEKLQVLQDAKLKTSDVDSNIHGEYRVVRDHDKRDSDHKNTLTPQNPGILNILQNAKTSSNNTDDKHVLKCNNLSIVEIVEKLQNAKLNTSNGDSNICDKVRNVKHNNKLDSNHKNTLARQSLGILDILHNAKISSNNSSQDFPSPQNATTKTEATDVNNNNIVSTGLSIDDILQKLHSSGKRLTTSSPRQPNIPNQDVHTKSPHLTMDQIVQKLHDGVSNVTSSKRSTTSAPRIKNRGQAHHHHHHRESSYPIPLPSTTGSDYETPCMYVVEFPQASQLPLPPPSFFQPRPKPSAIPKHMRAAMRARFQ